MKNIVRGFDANAHVHGNFSSFRSFVSIVAWIDLRSFQQFLYVPYVGYHLYLFVRSFIFSFFSWSCVVRPHFPAKTVKIE